MKPRSIFAPRRRRIYLGARGRVVLGVWDPGVNTYRLRDRMVEELRAEAYGPRPLDFELLRKVDLGQGRAAAWFPELPEECRPPRHCRRLTDDEVQELGDKLAARINAKCAQSGGSRAATPDSWTGTRVRGHAATVAAAVPPLPRRNSRRHAGLSSITDGTRGVRGVRGTESNTKTVSQGKLREEHEVDEREATS